MHLFGSLFRSSIGRKVLMAVTGLFLIGFVVGHLVGNLQVFQHPDHLNGYAQFLQQLGPWLWVARGVLLVSVVIHVWAATVLTLENNRARGPEAYRIKHTIRATLASRTMRLTGYVVLAFVVYHLAHFTWGSVSRESFKDNLELYTMQSDYKFAGIPVVKAGAEVHDVHEMVVLGFSHPLVSLFYIVAVGLLSFHLLHGLDSMFQTLGLRSGRWSGALRTIAVVFCVTYFAGNLLIPGAVLAGHLRPHRAGPAFSSR